MLRGDNALADLRAYYQKAFEVQNGLVSRNAREAVAAQQAPDLSLKSNLAATYTHWVNSKREPEILASLRLRNCGKASPLMRS